jgi:2-polyprenyl-3-methyl-5-hydroxy-6-metoxy-1,4-benzoquinol methylase
VTPFWHPLSAVLLEDPRAVAAPTLLRLLARGRAAIEVTYAGDRMWPAIAHGAKVAVAPGGDRRIARGDVVLAWPDGIADLLRVEAVRGEKIVLAGDAAPGERQEVGRDAVFGRVATDGPAVPAALRVARRLALDLREAAQEDVDASQDRSDTVKEKYETQAPSYERLDGPVWDPRLSLRVRAAVRPGGAILVVGSGAGHEAFALAREGFRVKGLDYAPAMIEAARRVGAARSIPVEFVLGDLRTHEEPRGSLGAVLFTYEVYSFIPKAAERVGALRRIERWLAPGGSIFLSARLVNSSYQRLILSVQRARRLGSGEREWGESHARWISPGGAIRRSFVRYLTRRALSVEIASAGFAEGEWEGGHVRIARRGEGRDR